MMGCYIMVVFSSDGCYIMVVFSSDGVLYNGGI